MAASSAACMARTSKFDYVPPLSTFCGISVLSCSCRMSTGWSMRKNTTLVIVSSGRKLGEGIAERECEPPWVANSRNTLETFGPSRKPAEVYHTSDSRMRVGFLIACPGLGLSMFDWNAIAVEMNPVSPSESSGATLARFVSLLGDLDPGSAQLITTFAGPLIAVFNLLFIFRIIMSWYPGIPVKKFPFFLAYNPTEPVLGPTRRLIPPVGGVDVAPVIWVAVMSFANEILLGKQGLLVLLSQQQS